jgi:hypothetical protein
MSRKTPKSATAPVEKKKRETKRIEPAREEWEKRQKRRRHEAEAATALAGPSAGKKNRKRRRKVWQTIASGRVGDGNGQEEIIDLRSPSRSPSIECLTPRPVTQRNFTLTPDTIVLSSSRNSTPGEGVIDMAISSLHHLTASLASLDSGLKRNETQSSQFTLTRDLGSTSMVASEEAVMAYHQLTPTYPTPHASRETSEEAIDIHHHNSASRSPTSHIARGISEEAVINHHHNSPTSQDTRGSSEEAIIMHHHTSPLPQGTSTMSEQAVVAYHHRSVSISPNPPISRETSEEAVIAHHHSSPPPARSQVIHDNPDGTPVRDRSISEHHHASATRSSHNSKPEGKEKSPVEHSEPVKPTTTEINEVKTFKSDSLSMLKSESSLLQPFAYPASTPLPSPPLTPMVKRASITGSFFKNWTQDEEDASMDPDTEYTTEGLTRHEPFTPPRDLLMGISAHHVPFTPTTPITPSRLGPSWKTETAPQSVIDDEEVDELESESGDDADEIETPRLLQYRLDTPLSFRHSLSPQKIEDRHEQDIDMENPYSNAWAFEYGIDPRQWDDIPFNSPTQVNHDGLHMDDHSESDEGCGSAKAGSSGEDGEDDGTDEDEDVVEGECGYRVFAGWADVVSTMSPEWDYRHQTAKSPGSSLKSFGSLTPRRPTAFEATTGGRYERHSTSHRPNEASPGSSTGRVSAELGPPLRTPLQAGDRSVTPGISPPYLFETGFHYNHGSMNASMPDTHQGPAAGGYMPKRDQIILVLLQAGHITLAEDVLRGET